MKEESDDKDVQVEPIPEFSKNNLDTGSDNPEVVEISQ